MITFGIGSMRFIYRVVGVALDQDRVLLHRAENEDFWTMPGGRCELLEPATDTLKREMLEELEAEVTVGRLLWVMENFFEYEGRSCHELALYFLMSLPPDSPLTGRTEPFLGDEEGTRLIFRWIPLDELEDLIILPSFLKTALKSPPEAITHLVHRDEN
jgi:ADP-ribose pyrophosphatase YjhB (NUDIX family)